jgi:hypothetical protein
LQLARAYYTIIGDEKAREETDKALTRATAFLRRQIGGPHPAPPGARAALRVRFAAWRIRIGSNES